MTKGVPTGVEEKCVQYFAANGSKKVGACGGFNLPWIVVILSVILLGWKKQRCYNFAFSYKDRAMHRCAL
jgi:hypothetical protein